MASPAGADEGLVGLGIAINEGLAIALKPFGEAATLLTVYGI
jgi:hypothetical protein